MSQRISHSPGLADLGAQLWRLPAGLLETVLTTVFLWSERMRQRQELLELSDYGLKDLGLTRGDAVREHSKWFWQE